ncbi:unnamed protein product [Alopecurus aequalis]
MEEEDAQLWSDGNHLWLRSREDGGYLHADNDGAGVSLHGGRKSLNTAWAVHVYRNDYAAYLLLHSAAYGGYLAATRTRAPRGHRGFRVVQRNYDEQELEAIKWSIVDGPGNSFLLRNVESGRHRYLRANGKFRPWNNAVSVDDNSSTMMHWIVECIPPIRRIPGLAAPVREGRLGDLSVALGLRAAPSWLEIRFVRASNDGLYDEEGNQGWKSCPLESRSVDLLRNKLASRLNVDAFNLIMCVRAGRYGRLTPLVDNLPSYGDRSTIEIVVITRYTPAAKRLTHPDVDASDPAFLVDDGCISCSPYK